MVRLNEEEDDIFRSVQRPGEPAAHCFKRCMLDTARRCTVVVHFRIPHFSDEWMSEGPIHASDAAARAEHHEKKGYEVRLENVSPTAPPPADPEPVRLDPNLYEDDDSDD